MTTPETDERPTADEERELLERLLRERTATARTFPASFAQRRLWVLDQLHPESPVYVVPIALFLDGALDAARLERSLAELARRHAVFRTRFATESGEPVQEVMPEVEIPLRSEDLAHLGADEAEVVALERANREAARPFDLTRAPLARAFLFRLAADRHLFLLTLHHSIVDAWSLPTLFEELGYFYRRPGGDDTELPDLPIQYADFAAWERRNATSPGAVRELEYWRERLGGELPVLELPSDRGRPPVQTYRGAWASHRVSRDALERLRALAGERKVTLFTLLLSGFAVLLNRLTGATDLLVGVPVGMRRRAETEPLVGLFVNTVVLRLDLAGDPDFTTLLDRVREATLGALEHADTPFERLVEELQPERDVSRNPLFQVLFEMESEPPPQLALEGLAPAPMLGPDRVHTGTAKADLAIAVEEGSDSLLLGVEYSTDLFDRETVERFLEQFAILLEEATRTPTRPISALDLLSEDQRRQLLQWGRAVSPPPPEEGLIHEVFAAVVSRRRAAVAVAFGDQELTYGELDTRAEALAYELRRLGVEPNAIVGILMERSLELVVAIVATLKAGGAYLPLDPSYPPQRLADMVQDARPQVVLTRERWSGLLEGSDVPLLDLDSEAIGGRAERRPSMEEPTAIRVRPGDVAYVMYTSGTTGRPKGVRIPHQAVVRLVHGVDYITYGEDETLLLLSSISFDPSTMEIWGALLHGARLVIAPPETPTLEGLAELIRRDRISLLHLSTTLFHQMMQTDPTALGSVRQMVVGGDVLSPSHVRTALEHLESGGRIVNGYGPTECTMLAICNVISEPSELGERVSLGRPIAGREVFVLDAARRLGPIGVPGEIHLGGPGLAVDYLARPALTAESFGPHPFAAEPGQRLYATGDVGRWLPDGRVDFFGRRDRQVKIRGYRVELGEIEAVLSQRPDVLAAAVEVVEFGENDERLVAYFESAGPSVSVDALRQYARDRLPRFMVPSHFVGLERLPRTPTGKVDRSKLELPQELSTEHPSLPTAAQEPERPDDLSPTERQIAEIWSEVLKVESVERHDNFFDLGGHSLLLLQVFSRLHGIYGRRVSVIDLFRYPTVASLATLFDPQQSEDKSTPQLFEGFFLGPEHEQIFACYHPPRADEHRDTAIVFCPPVGYEYMSLHRASRQLAVELSRSGFPVLRFDYYGTGDSAGSPADGRVERWLEDTARAVDEARRRAETSRVCLIGMRLGATLAWQWSRDDSGPSALVLLDPVLSGEALVGEMRAKMRFALRKAHVKSRSESRSDRPPEWLGYPMSPELWSSLEAVDLDFEATTSAERVLLVDSRRNRELGRFESALKARGLDVELRREREADDLWAWSEDLSRIQLPERLMRDLAQWCVENCR
ncbi:MAG: amino acid adenylation domain-containing protein [Thermoanaerobaculia bacterium]|nr:amino acid adenylation domain-containing protein [Thermoanaerobaculia bacterium]